MSTNTRREHLYGLEGIHLDAYDVVVKPGRVFAVRTYTLRRWAPILGSTGFWLLVALQQLCYRNPRGDDWCVVSRPDLAEAAGLSETTVHRYLRGEEHTEFALHHWIQAPDPQEVRHRPRRWSVEAGRMVQPPNRYAVVMDAPLAPVDQRGLAQFLREHGVGPGTPANQVEPVLRRLIDLSLADLLDLCDELAERFAPPPSWSEGAFYPTVGDVVSALGVEMPNDGREQAQFLELCSRVQQAFVGQTHLGTQYFLRQWMPILGHKLALVVLQLRSHCFWDAEEHRNTVRLPFTHLAKLAGCSPRWLKEINDTRPESGQFFLVEHAGRGSPPTFQVELLEPIAPQDKAQYERLLHSGAVADDEGSGPCPTKEMEKGTDELLKRGRSREKGTGENEKGTDELLRRGRSREKGTGENEKGMDELLRSEPVDGSPTQKGTGGLLRSEPTNCSPGEKGTGGLLRSEPTNCSPGKKGTDELLRSERVNTQKGTGEHHVNTIITITNTNARKALKQQHLRARARAPAATALLLADFGIGSPSDRRILDLNPDENDVRAWMLYALVQPGLDGPDRSCGYVVNRLLGRDPPPPRFRSWARLTPSGWRALWRAARYAGPYVVALPAELAGRLEAWVSDFLGIFPHDGPFGDSVVDQDRIQAAIAETGEDATALANLVITVRGDTVYLRPQSEESHRWVTGQADRLGEALRRQGILHRLEILDVEETAAPDELTRIWQDVLEELQLRMTQATFDTWLRQSRLVKISDGSCIVEVESDRARDWLKNRLLTTIEDALEQVMGQAMEVRLLTSQS